MSKEELEMSPKFPDEERDDWVRLSLESLARAYSDVEPAYPFSIKEANPTYVCFFL